MALDFQQVHEQVRRLGENAPRRARLLAEQRARACQLLDEQAAQADELRDKIQHAVRLDPTLRCASPLEETINGRFLLPPLPGTATLLAADGSQINPDRHAPVQYCLVNVGVIQMNYGASQPPRPTIHSQLFYDEQIHTETGLLSDALVALRRDLSERQALVERAAQATAPVITLTDGPIELWGAKDSQDAHEFRRSLEAYLSSLAQLQEMNAITAGYVDKPSADLVVRMLEVAQTPSPRLADIRKERPLRGVTDIDLYGDLLQPGERSAVFVLQSGSEKDYRGPLALRFFYLNVGRATAPWLARVEIPAWVAEDAQKLDALQAVLVDQCKTLGSRPYPYLLHRAHEVAVVSLEEKDQLTQMIILELRRRGVPVGEASHKQAAKDLGKRTRYP